jgi:hypothetical protein
MFKKINIILIILIIYISDYIISADLISNGESNTVNTDLTDAKKSSNGIGKLSSSINGKQGQMGSFKLKGSLFQQERNNETIIPSFKTRNFKKKKFNKNLIQNNEVKTDLNTLTPNNDAITNKKKNNFRKNKFQKNKKMADTNGAGGGGGNKKKLLKSVLSMLG